MKAVAILPMRAGSQRVVNKNVRIIAGKPLYTYMVETLLRCNEIGEIIINTDIDEVFSRYGKEKKISLMRRKPELSGNCSMNMVIHDTIRDRSEDVFIQVHATNPLLSAETLDRALVEYGKRSTEIDSLFSVTRVQKRFWDENCSPINHDVEKAPTTQDLSPMFEENSCFYIFNRNVFFECNNRIGKKPAMFEISTFESVDIDTEDEMMIAEYALTAKYGDMNR